MGGAESTRVGRSERMPISPRTQMACSLWSSWR